MEIVRAEHLKKYYEGPYGIVKAVDDVSVEFYQGSFTSVVGRSGSGKTTLLHMLGGLVRPTEGEIFYRGKNISSYTNEEMAVFRRRHVGFVFQQYNLLEDYNILDNMCMPLKLDHKKPDKVYLEQVVARLGLEKKLKCYPSELSGGEMQRVAIGRSLLARPDILLADEPTGNLDRKIGESIINLIENCAREFGQTVVMVTHDMELARRADRVVTLEDGMIVK